MNIADEVIQNYRNARSARDEARAEIRRQEKAFERQRKQYPAEAAPIHRELRALRKEHYNLVSATRELGQKILDIIFKQ